MVKSQPNDARFDFDCANLANPHTPRQGVYRVQRYLGLTHPHPHGRKCTVCTTSPRHVMCRVQRECGKAANESRPGGHSYRVETGVAPQVHGQHSCCHPSGNQGCVRGPFILKEMAVNSISSARTPHSAYVEVGWRNQEKSPTRNMLPCLFVLPCLFEL